jgi:large subunit ribosomal protein L46
MSPSRSRSPLLSSFQQQADASSLYSACIFERLPLVMPSPPQWELDYATWQETLMARRLKPVPKEFTDDKRVVDEQASGGPSAESRWQPAPLETAADRSGDKKTTRRRLDQRIFMLIKKKNGTWEFPHVALEQGENTRTGAERALREVLGDGEGTFQPYFVGNAPAGHVALTNGIFFFHRCQLVQGTPPAMSPGSQWGEVAWAAKDELGEYIKDESTLELLQKML